VSLTLILGVLSLHPVAEAGSLDCISQIGLSVYLARLDSRICNKMVQKLRSVVRPQANR
jgi:hypothetical protein